MTSEIAASDIFAAAAVSEMIENSKLNSNLGLEGLPQAKIDSVENNFRRLI